MRKIKPLMTKGSQEPRIGLRQTENMDGVLKETFQWIHTRHHNFVNGTVSYWLELSGLCFEIKETVYSILCRLIQNSGYKNLRNHCIWKVCPNHFQIVSNLLCLQSSRSSWNAIYFIFLQIARSL